MGPVTFIDQLYLLTSYIYWPVIFLTKISLKLNNYKDYYEIYVKSIHKNQVSHFMCDSDTLFTINFGAINFGEIFTVKLISMGYKRFTEYSVKILGGIFKN